MGDLSVSSVRHDGRQDPVGRGKMALRGSRYGAVWTFSLLDGRRGNGDSRNFAPNSLDPTAGHAWRTNEARAGIV